MEKFMNLIDKYVVPVASKIGQQRHMIAIRDGFIAMLALTMLSSLCTLIQYVPFEPLNNWLNTTEMGMHIVRVCQNISWGTFSFMAIIACFAISYNLSKSYGAGGLEGALTATAVFIGISPATITKDSVTVSGLSSGNFGAASLFTALICALVTVEIFRKLSESKRLKVKLPSSVPPAVSRSFEVLFPGMISVTIMVTIAYIIQATTGMFISEIISTVLQKPLQGITNSLGAAILIPFFNSFFWALGLHGNNLLSPITTPLLTPLSAENMALAAAGAVEGYNTITSPFFFAYAWHGGSGATLALLIAIIIAGKKIRKRHAALTSLAVGPGVFNINEPVIFGLPIVLNPIYAIPFILAPVAGSVIAYFAIEIGLVGPTIVQNVPWVMPPILYGIVATGSWQGGALSAFTLLVAIIIYYPFVQAAYRIELREGANNNSDEDNGMDEVKEEKMVKEVNIDTDKQIKIMLACAGGMSTSLLGKKMEEEGTKRGYNIKVWAIGIGQIQDYTGQYDCLLLGPQVRASYDKIKDKQADSDKPCELINSIHYGKMNYSEVLDRALELIEQNK